MRPQHPRGRSLRELPLLSAAHQRHRLAKGVNEERQGSSRTPPALFLFEDIDRVIGHPGNEVTMAGLLSVLDGVVAQEGRIVFLTTNHLPQLDPALIRPGRIDLQEHLGFVTPDQARRFFGHFFPAAPEQAVLFARWAGDGRWTMAQLQDHLISHVDDPHTASRPSGKAIAVAGTLFSATPS
ncbi:MAG: AAA family ATPase [Candidatus Latescibacteria bacterium]|nr:AAA family ATPase [Candidatus Latescibacterota bacterium]